VALDIVADGTHSVPTQLQLVNEAGETRQLDLPAIADAAAPNATTHIDLPFRALSSNRKLTLTVTAPSPPRSTHTGSAPVAIAEVVIAQVPTPATPVAMSSTCRTDLVRADGSPLPVRVAGSVASARTGLALEPCAGPVHLSAGSHHVTTAKG